MVIPKHAYNVWYGFKISMAIFSASTQSDPDIRSFVCRFFFNLFIGIMSLVLNDVSRYFRETLKILTIPNEKTNIKYYKIAFVHLRNPYSTNTAALLIAANVSCKITVTAVTQ